MGEGRFSVIVINLDADTARLAHMRAQLARAGLPFERFSAVSGRDLSPWQRAHLGLETGAGLLSAGEVGCYASHLEVCRRIAAGEIEAPALVLEDDVALDDDFSRAVNDVLRALPESWDVVRLSNRTKHACFMLAELGDGRALVRYSNVPGSAGATLWSKAGAAKFLHERPRALPLDQDLRLVWAWGLDTYGVLPPPARRDQCESSSIDRMAPNGWRSDPQRVRKIRRFRSRAALQRHWHGVKTVGFGPWLAAEAANLLGLFRRRAGGPRVLGPLKS